MAFLKTGSLGRRTPAFFFGQQVQELRSILDDPAADDIDASCKKWIREVPGGGADDADKCIRCAMGKDIVQRIVQNGGAGT